MSRETKRILAPFCVECEEPMDVIEIGKTAATATVCNNDSCGHYGLMSNKARHKRRHTKYPDGTIIPRSPYYCVVPSYIMGYPEKWEQVNNS